MKAEVLSFAAWLKQCYTIQNLRTHNNFHATVEVTGNQNYDAKQNRLETKIGMDFKPQLEFAQKLGAF
jgi:hypothetical protein